VKADERAGGRTGGGGKGGGPCVDGVSAAPVGSGSFGPLTIKGGGLVSIGRLNFPLFKVRTPSRIKPDITIEGTKYPSNWQWWHIVENSRSIILDETPADYRPIVHVVDNFARNHKLGLLFETNVGKGSLLICASDLPARPLSPVAA
jgi:hypothetical protein